LTSLSLWLADGGPTRQWARHRAYRLTLKRGGLVALLDFLRVYGTLDWFYSICSYMTCDFVFPRNSLHLKLLFVLDF
jgi:hypothetical protein